jgi:diguanylate cyclase (GGDEF)-like protein
MNEDSVPAVDAANERAWNSTIENPQSSLEEAERALASALPIHYIKGQADAYLNIGWANYYLSRLPEAYGAFTEASCLYEAMGDILGTCRTLNAFGVYHQFVFRLDKSIDFYTRSLTIARANGLLDRELIAMANIGEVCLELGDPQQALDYLMPAYGRMTAEVDTEVVADCLRNIGEAFLVMDNLVMAAEFTRKSYEIALAADETIMATDSLETLANVAIASNDLTEAGNLVNKGLELAAKTGNLSQRASLLIVRASMFNDLGRAQEALVLLLESEQLCEGINLKSKLFKAHEQISRSYEALGDYGQALAYFKRFADFKAKVQREETANKLRSIQAQSEIERAQQEAEIYRLRNIDLKEKTDALVDINRQITSISTIGRRITASLDFNMVVQTIYDCLKPFLDMDMFGIALHDPERGQLVYKRFYEEGIRKNEYRINVDSESSFAAWAFKNRKPVLIADKDKEYATYLSRPSTTAGPASQSVVCMPLAIEDRAIGVMTIQNYKAHAYAPNHLSFLEALAPYVGIAVENAIIHDRLEDLNHALSDEKRRLERATLKISHLANHDSLTGLPNRRLLFELMGKTVETARRTGGKIGVVFIDLDDFKPINDIHGHAAGDSALVAISERLRGLVRASDIVARIGGDEFVAVVTNVKSRDDIERVAKKIISECSTPLSFSGKSSTLGMSMGISVFPDDGDAIEELVNKADAAMYGVKHIAKNAYAFSSVSPA